MIKNLWLNLPVSNVKKSADFFSAIGLKINEHYGIKENSASFFIGDKNVVLMLFDHATFSNFLPQSSKIGSTEKEVLISIDAESKEEVDELAAKVVSAGGSTEHKPYELQGNMYGCVFMDLDGHLWNILYMKQ